MIVQKTVRAKIVSLTKSKEGKLEREYANFQLALKGNVEASLYSATKQQAQRLLKRIKGKGKGGGEELREQPLVIRRDLFKIQKQETNKVAKWWARIPVVKKSIWVAVELPKNQESLLGLDIRECRLVKEAKNWSLRITVQKETSFVMLNPEEKNILAVRSRREAHCDNCVAPR